MDIVRVAAVGRHGDRLRMAGQHADPIGLDERVENKGAARLALAVAAMATMNEHRLTHETIPHSCARAAAVECADHVDSADSPDQIRPVRQR